MWANRSPPSSVQNKQGWNPRPVRVEVRKAALHVRTRASLQDGGKPQTNARCPGQSIEFKTSFNAGVVGGGWWVVGGGWRVVGGGWWVAGGGWWVAGGGRWVVGHGL